MTWISIKNKDYVAHRSWAHSLFSLGFMFTSTRIFIFLFNLLNIERKLSYFLAVLSAGVAAILYLII